MNILFVCKANKFRSKIAEAYFNKINKNKDIKVDSAGLISGTHPPTDNLKKIASKYGIELTNKRQDLTTELIKWQDILVIVADDVPPSIFNNEKHGKKTLIWKIPDANKDELEKTENSIKMIIEKIDIFSKELG